jgi:hypothetical protein
MRRGWDEGGCSYPGRPEWVPRASAHGHHRRKRVVDHSGVSSGHSTGGDHLCREGPNVSPSDGPDGLAIGAWSAAIPRGAWAYSRGERVKPSDAGAERSADPASPEPVPSPCPRHGSLGEPALAREPRPGVKRVEANAGGPGPDGLTSAVPQGPLARPSQGPRRRHVPTIARPAGDDPETRRRRARAGRADGPRSLPPASVVPGAVTRLRASLLGPQLWLPAGQERPPGGQRRPAGNRGGPELRRRHRSGPVLRPRRARRPDGPRGPKGGRPAGVENSSTVTSRPGSWSMA